MNVVIKWENIDITHHVIEYTRQHDICSGIGTLDLTVEGSTDFDFLPWNQIKIEEEGQQVAIYNITSTEKTAPGGTYIISAQDNSKRLTDYFIDTQIVTEDISYTKYWLEQVLSYAGVVDYSINVTGNGEPVTIGTSFGMQQAYDAVINLLQLSGWYMYFDRNGVCQISNLDGNKSPVQTFNYSDELRFKKTSNDKDIRNRVYIWGRFDETTQSWIHASTETYLPWLRDDGEDYRSIVYQNSSIYYISSALALAEKLLATFSRQISEKEVEVVGLYPNIVVGNYIRTTGGVGQVTSYIVNVNSEGAVTTFIIDKICPRLFGYSDIESEKIYIGTDTNGVWYKTLDGGYWYSFNTNIENKNIKDLSAYDSLLSTVTLEGKLYRNKYGYWSEITVPSGLMDECPTTSGYINSASGFYTACSIDRYIGSGGAVNGIFTVPLLSSGIQMNEILPTFPASGNRSWVVSFTPDGEIRYSHQIKYFETASGIPYVISGMVYDIGAVDLETNDLGHNIISTYTADNRKWGQSSFGSYSTYAWQPFVGKDIYVTLPPATEGIDIRNASWGGLKTAFPGQATSGPIFYFSPSGWDGGYVTVAHNTVTQEHITIREKYLSAIDNSEVYIGLYSIPVTQDQYNCGHYRFLRISDNIFNVLVKNGTSNMDGIHQFDTSSLSLVNEIYYPNVTVFENPEEWETLLDTGSDGDVSIRTGIISKRYLGGTEYSSGYGYVRVINVRTGGMTQEIIRYDDPPPIYGGGLYYVEFAGYDETPNHIVLAITATNSGETAYEDSPKTIIELFVINKYTGDIKHSQIIRQWYDPNMEAWASEHRKGLWITPAMTDGDGGIHAHRHPFLKCLYEDPTTGDGYALLHLPHILESRIWTQAFSLVPQPGYYWGYYRWGYLFESKLIKISLSDGEIIGDSSFVDMVVGNPLTLPVIEPYESYPTPGYLLMPYHQIDNIYATYSRNILDSPVVFNMYRTRTDTMDECVIALVNPQDLNSYATIDPNNEYNFYNYSSEDYPVSHLKEYSETVFLDCIDDSIYLVTTSGTSSTCILFGFDKNGNVTKRLTGDFGGGRFYSDDLQRIMGNKFIYGNYYWRGFMNWPGVSGITDSRGLYKVLYHNPEIPSGLFTVLYSYLKPLALETGMGLPTIMYDPPLSSGSWGDIYTNMLGASYTNIPPVDVKYPISNIVDARLLDIYDTFPLVSGEELPDNSIKRFLGYVSNDDDIKLSNTEFKTFPDIYSQIAVFSGGLVNHVDFTNYFPSPYIFISIITESGQKFYQRYTNQDTFYDLSTNLPSGAKITIIRADDRI